MNLDEVVGEIRHGNRSRMILQLVRESVAQARWAGRLDFAAFFFMVQAERFSK